MLILEGDDMEDDEMCVRDMQELERNEELISATEEESIFERESYIQVSDVRMGGDGTPKITHEGDTELSAVARNKGRDALVIRTDPNDMALAHVWRYNENVDGNVLSYKKNYTVIHTDGFFDSLYSRMVKKWGNVKRKDYGDSNTVIYADTGLIVLYRSMAAQTVVLNMLCTESEFPEFKDSITKMVDEFYAESPMTMHWYMKRYGGFEKRVVPIPVMYDLQEVAYPYIEGGVNNFLDNFNRSIEPIMILIGEPGTGKTSLVRHYIKKYGRKAAVTFDEELIGSDQFMVDFMTSKSVDTLIVEDADLLIGSRDKGLNQHMNKFLNMSNGIVAMPEKKIIFSTNLNNVRDIDDALMRPGRCFDVVHFRKLTKSEALLVNPNLAGNENEYSLAEAYAGRAVKGKSKFGFVR